MLIHGTNLFDLDIQATDGEIGTVHDLYFDDKSWEIRYLIIDTGNWLSGRRVLIAPEAIGTPNWEKGVVPVNLSKEAVKNSPAAMTAKPISRQYEVELHQHYNWTPYWTAPTIGATYANVSTMKPQTPATVTRMPLGNQPDPVTDSVAERVAEREETAVAKNHNHLRSMREVVGYHIKAMDGLIGHVETFLLDSNGWRVQYLVVDTRNWLPGRKIPISLNWVSDVNWVEQVVSVKLHKETIEESPEVDLDGMMSDQSQSALEEFFSKLSLN